MLATDPVFLLLTTSEPGGVGELVRFEALRGDECFEQLAQPSSRLSLSQTRFTGLSNKDLASAPELEETLENLLEFCKDAGSWIVPCGTDARLALETAAANAGFPRGFGPAAAGLDELGGLVLPAVCRRGVADLLSHYKLTEPARNSGVPASLTPQLLRELWLRLEYDLLKLPLPVLAEMNWLIGKSSHPLKQLLKVAEKQAVGEKFGAAMTEGKLSFAGLFQDFSGIIKRLDRPLDIDRAAKAVPDSVLEPEESPDSAEEDLSPPLHMGFNPEWEVPAKDVADLLGPHGPLSKKMSGYEERPEQLALASKTAEALSQGQHLMAEAGTGVGKSLAYLTPAVLFAKRARRPVLISTHTKNLQAQLFEKDLPLLKESLGLEFEAALLKGRSNYLCVSKFLRLLQDSNQELDEEDRAALLPVLTWAAQTETGDVGELAAFSPETHYELWDRMHTTGDDCLGRQCPLYQYCFVYKARGMARTADLVVLNHALVFAGLNQERGALPPFDELIFDEAHTLESVATEHLACEITPRRVRKILDRLYKTKAGQEGGKGLLSSLLFQLDLARQQFPPPVFEKIHANILSAIQLIEPAEQGGEQFQTGLWDWFERRVDSGAPADESSPRERRPDFAPANTPFALPRPPRPPSAQKEESARRFSATTLRPEEAQLIQIGKEALVSGLGKLRQALEKIEDDFEEIKKREVGRARELRKEISAQNLFLQELIHDLEWVVKGDEPNYVYWIERIGKRSLRAVAAPLDLAGLLHDQLFERKRSIVLASATLSLRDEHAEGDGLNPIRSMNPPARLPEATPANKPHPKSFEFLKRRLGLNLLEAGRLDEVLEGSPFNYEQQCRLYIPTFLPEPGKGRERDYNQALSAMIARLAIASGGRALALFTSYQSLEWNAEYLRKALAGENITVLAQGADGSRETLLARLKAGGRVLLLGTASFWEGVDVPGDALSLLLITKLPFAVFTDPLIEGRCELLEKQGKDPFLHFSVPHAILKLRQGFGRLIRSKRDRGVAVLCDKRVLTRRYGAAFLRALPCPARPSSDAQLLASEIEQFLRLPE